MSTMKFVWIHEILVILLQVLLCHSEDCLKEEIKSDQGLVQSPNYPKRYKNNLKCTWRITVAETFIIRLEFTSFELDSNKKGICKDLLQIYDGEEQNSLELFKSCAKSFQQLESKIVLSRGNTLLLKLTTNKSRRKRGFSANYTSYPVSTIGMSTTTSTPNGTIETSSIATTIKPSIAAVRTTVKETRTKLATQDETTKETTKLETTPEEARTTKGAETITTKLATNSRVILKATTLATTTNKATKAKRTVTMKSQATTNDAANNEPPTKLASTSTTKINPKWAIMTTLQTEAVANTKVTRKEETTQKMTKAETPTQTITTLYTSTHKTATQKTIQEISTQEIMEHETASQEMITQETTINGAATTEEVTYGGTTTDVISKTITTTEATVTVTKVATTANATATTKAKTTTNKTKPTHESSTKLASIIHSATTGQVVKTNEKAKGETGQETKAPENSTQEITTVGMTTQEIKAHEIATHKTTTPDRAATTKEVLNSSIMTNVTPKETTATQMKLTEVATSTKGTTTTSINNVVRSVNDSSTTQAVTITKVSKSNVTTREATTGELTKTTTATTKATLTAETKRQNVTTKETKTKDLTNKHTQQATATIVVPTSKEATPSKGATTSKGGTAKGTTRKSSSISLTAATTTTEISSSATETGTKFELLPTTSFLSDIESSYPFSPGEFSKTSTSGTFCPKHTPANFTVDPFVVLYGTVPSLLLLIAVLAFVVFAISLKRKEKKVSSSSTTTTDNYNHCATLIRDVDVTEQPDLFNRVGYKKDEHVYESSLGEMIRMKKEENKIDEFNTSMADEGEIMNIIYESHDGNQHVPVCLKDEGYSGGVTSSDTVYETVKDSYNMTEVYDESRWESEEGFEIYVIYEPNDEMEEAADTVISSECVKA